MTVSGIYVNTPLADLQTMRVDTLAWRKALLAGQSYSIAGRSKQNVTLDSIRMELAEIDFAIARAGGNIIMTSVPDMSGGDGGRCR